MLIFAILILLAAGAVARLCPDTPLGRLLNRSLIEAPAAWLDSPSPRKIIVAVAVVIFVLAAPEMALLVGADLTLFVEATVAASLAVGQLRWRQLVQRITAASRGLAQGIQRLGKTSGRQAGGRRERPRSLDDGEGAGLAFA